MLHFIYHFVLFLQQHNYTVTTSTRTRKWSIYIKCSIFNNSYMDWCFYCDCSCCSCVIMLLLLLMFICHCASTITYEAEQNDIVTTTTTTTNRFIYINCEILFFTLVLLLLCHVVVLVQLELLIHNHRWTRRITTFNSNNNKQGEGVYMCLSNAFSIVCTEETCEQ